jgi:hypothetical protein
MTRIHAFLLLCASLLVCYVGGAALHESPSDDAPAPSVQPVNAVLGNASFETLFGTAPTATTPERLRLRAHLATVESILRARDVSHLPPEQQARRTTMLDALHDYWQAGRFPQNTEVPGRTPIFIDAKGRLCAVGHLITESVGRDVAEWIDERYHFAHVREMNAPLLDQWATRYGFTRSELAMIQPAYRGPIREPGTDDRVNEAAEAASLSLSAGSALLNGIIQGRGMKPSWIAGGVGVGTGATSLAIGLSDRAHFETADVLAGVSSVVLGGWTLIDAIRTGGDGDEPAIANESSAHVQVGPTVVTPKGSDSRPGVQLRIQF